MKNHAGTGGLSSSDNIGSKLSLRDILLNQKLKDELFNDELNLDEYAKHHNFTENAILWIIKDNSTIVWESIFVILVAVLGIVGNLTIIYSIVKNKKIRSKPTNAFILSMAIADLFTSMVSPTVALIRDIYQFYILGDFMCKFEGFLMGKLECI